MENKIKRIFEGKIKFNLREVLESYINDRCLICGKEAVVNILSAVNCVCIPSLLCKQCLNKLKLENNKITLNDG